MQPNIPDEVVEYLHQKGTIERLAEARQAEREEERARLINEIVGLQKTEATMLPLVLEQRRKASAALEAAEAELQQARITLAEANSKVSAADASFRIEQRSGKLATLADPRLHHAISQLRDFEMQARQRGFCTWTDSERTWDMTRKIRTEHNNANVLDEVVAEIRNATTNLEALLYVPRPEKLTEILDAALSAGEAACRRVGVTAQRFGRLTNTAQH